MVTNGTQQQYRQSIDAIDAELNAHERAAFNWAVAGMNLEEGRQGIITYRAKSCLSD